MSRNVTVLTIFETSGFYNPAVSIPWQHWHKYISDTRERHYFGDVGNPSLGSFGGDHEPRQLLRSLHSHRNTLPRPPFFESRRGVLWLTGWEVYSSSMLSADPPWGKLPFKPFLLYLDPTWTVVEPLKPLNAVMQGLDAP